MELSARETIACAVLFVATVAGCNGAPDPNGRTTKPASTARTAPVTTALAPEVVSVSSRSVKAGAGPLVIGFSFPIDPNTLVEGRSWFAVTDDDASPGSSWHQLYGTVELDAAGTTLSFTPDEDWRGEREVRLILTAALTGTNGVALKSGAVSEPLTFTTEFPDQVFEARVIGTDPADGVVPERTTAPTDPAPDPTAAGAFEIVRTTPVADSVTVVPTAIYLEFSEKVDRATIAPQTIAVIQVPRGSTNFRVIPVGVEWEADDKRLALIPQYGFEPGDDLVVGLTSGVKDVNGQPLAQGAASSPLTLPGLAGQVFELRFRPLSVPTPACPTDPAVFKAGAGTDVWHVDFETRAAALADEMKARGFQSGDATTDRLALARLEAYVLAHASRIYGRATDGAAKTGAWKISFTATAPTGTPGVTHNRIVIGGTSSQQGVVGHAPYDADNRSKEDVKADDEGIWSGSIDGIRSQLEPALDPTDRKFLDGSYALGSGTAEEDARARRVRVALDDWGRAIATVLAHEVGHAVGCEHVEGRYSLMAAVGSKGESSDPRTGFVGANVATLDANLGRH